MSALVLGSILIYSFYLPQAAPKQITLAVLPFSENSEFTNLSVGFTAALRDSIALSRDVAVVDSVSTNAAMWDIEKSSGMSHILALTHFVDGELHTVDGELTHMDFRVVNVSQPNWKEVLKATVPDLSASTDLQEVRDSLTLQVRRSLYDNSSLRTESSQHDADTYREYVHSLGAWFLGNKPSKLLSTLHEAYQAKTKDLYETTGITTEPSRELWNAVATFERTQDVREFSQTLWRLADEYPNSLAVDALGSFAYDLGKLRLAERAWLHAARVQPQSAFIALHIAHVRRLFEDSDGTNQAFRIAELRDDLGFVQYFKTLDEQSMQISQTTVPPSLDSAVIEALIAATDGRLRGDFLIEASIHAGVFGSQSPNTVETVKLWRSPPLWLSEDDPRWQEGRSFLAQHFPSASVRLSDDLLPAADSEDEVARLFTPRRPD